jgi:hypothetical protein
MVSADVRGSVLCVSKQPSDAAPSVQSDFQFAADIVSGEATVVITNLDPVTTYAVYCSAVSKEGATMELEAALALSTLADGSTVQITTLCCKTLSISLKSSTYRQGKVYLDDASLTFSHAPATSATVSIFANHTSRNVSTLRADMFTPAVFTVSSGATLFFTFRSASTDVPTGEYILFATVSSDGGYEFDTSAAKAEFSLLSDATAAPAPKLVAAVFSNDGATFSVTFNTRSDQGYAQVRDSFPFLPFRLLSLSCGHFRQL